MEAMRAGEEIEEAEELNDGDVEPQSSVLGCDGWPSKQRQMFIRLDASVVGGRSLCVCREWIHAFIDACSQFGKSSSLLLPAVGQDAEGVWLSLLLLTYCSCFAAQSLNST